MRVLQEYQPWAHTKKDRYKITTNYIWLTCERRRNGSDTSTNKSFLHGSPYRLICVLLWCKRWHVLCICLIFPIIRLIYLLFVSRCSVFMSPRNESVCYRRTMKKLCLNRSRTQVARVLPLGWLILPLGGMLGLCSTDDECARAVFSAADEYLERDVNASDEWVG